MLDYNPESLIKLRTMKMPYGKYRGISLIDLPEPYVVWYYDNNLPAGDSKNELSRLMRELYEIKVNGLEALIKSLDI